MNILGIDPGYERVGIAVINKQPGQKETLLFSDCFRTPPKLPFSERLVMIGDAIGQTIGQYQIDALSIETLFFKNNQKTAMGVSEARGVIIYKAASQKIPVYEYSPLQIKLTITGYGKSDKEQMIKMIPMLVKITKPIKYDDEYDAIAAALTCSAHERSFPQKLTS
ncbi:MAG: crossover junction endodeoxyribonuclease RuvC [Patescibacteria group bacterium]